MTATHRRMQTLASRDRLIAGLPVGVFRVTTAATPRISYANERFAEMVGYPDAAAVLGLPVASVLGEDEPLAPPADATGMPEPTEVRIAPTEGPPFWALLAVYHADVDAAGTLEGVIVDIGATKRAEQLLAEALDATRADLTVTERLWELSVTTTGFGAFAEAALGVLTAGPTITWAGVVRPARTDGVDRVATVGGAAPPEDAVTAVLSAVYADETSVRQSLAADSSAVLMGAPVWAEGLLEAVLVTALPAEPSADTVALVGDVAGALGYKRTVDLRERLPPTDHFTEVEVQVRDGEHPVSTLLAAADAADATVACTPTRVEGETMWYLTAADDALVTGATDAVTVVPAGAALRVGVPTGALHRRLGLEGARLTALDADAVHATLTLQVRSDTAVAAIVAEVRAAFPSAQLRARRQVTPEPLSPQLLAPIDDDQRHALETATRLGFFARPQGATAEEVATTLGTSRSTLMRRLRGAEERVFEHLFGDDDPDD
ncbi:MAG: helix-turn-helix domain-containing protein [Haloferacaceae archaeon]|nr:helix-turn-helix domain-containing protein [Haloferacaceae archaeon]